MNYDEGKIRVTEKPHITIGDKPLEKCAWAEVQLAILYLCKTIQQLRTRLDEK